MRAWYFLNKFWNSFRLGLICGTISVMLITLIAAGVLILT